MVEPKTQEITIAAMTSEEILLFGGVVKTVGGLVVERFLK